MRWPVFWGVFNKRKNIVFDDTIVGKQLYFVVHKKIYFENLNSFMSSRLTVCIAGSNTQPSVSNKRSMKKSTLCMNINFKICSIH